MVKGPNFLMACRVQLYRAKSQDTMGSGAQGHARNCLVRDEVRVINKFFVKDIGRTNIEQIGNQKAWERALEARQGETQCVRACL